MEATEGVLHKGKDVIGSISDSLAGAGKKIEEKSEDVKGKV